MPIWRFLITVQSILYHSKWAHCTPHTHHFDTFIRYAVGQAAQLSLFNLKRVQYQARAPRLDFEVHAVNWSQRSRRFDNSVHFSPFLLSQSQKRDRLTLIYDIFIHHLLYACKGSCSQREHPCNSLFHGVFGTNRAPQLPPMPLHTQFEFR